jgi:plasmid stabilization system protein ParE
MSGYALTPLADADLDEIWNYVAENGSVETADRLEDQLHAAMERLAEMPGIGHLRDDLAEEPLRLYLVHRLLIVYRPETRPLEVVRVLHGSRDLRAILRSGGTG